MSPKGRNRQAVDRIPAVAAAWHLPRAFTSPSDTQWRHWRDLLQTTDNRGLLTLGLLNPPKPHYTPYPPHKSDHRVNPAELT